MIINNVSSTNRSKLIVLQVLREKKPYKAVMNILLLKKQTFFRIRKGFYYDI